ncbi:TetR/AcrR family transcriptional regulator [Parvibaculum lavamentivorans]|uniref:TetR/AcrR family transcriptional regulator n=1 Tax=Parvibaculum lavamentivorans TaxID=256618 RepID=UPI0002F0B31E|nr:TetR/AcrR family transcriptional regulator [Parvibaculum lavamentivorans]
MAAAKSLFLDDGIDHVSMRKIARKVGITQAAIYQHFENKEAILFVIIEDFFSDLLHVFEVAVSQETEPLAQLRRAMRTYIDFGLSRTEEYRLVFMTPMSGLVRAGVAVPRTEEAKLTPSKGSLAFDMLDSCVHQVVEAGATRDLDPDLVSEAIWAAGHGIVSLLITHEHFPWTDREALIDLEIGLLLEGLLPAGSPARGENQGGGSSCPFGGPR